MKQKIYIAALLAGMLVLAGCGGGSSSDDSGDNGTRTLTAGEINELEETARKGACTGDGLTYDESSMLCKVDTSAADAKKAAADARALHTLIGAYDRSTSLIPGATTPPAFTNAKDADKGHAMITVDGTALTSGELMIDSGPERMNAKSDAFGGRDAKEHPRSQKSDGTLEDLKVSGTYYGISGMFTCTGTGICTSQNGQPKAVDSTDWTFAPTNPDAKRKVDIKWGWWVTRATTAGCLLATSFVWT